ncbi:GNAT family N-acetyltransferase [Oxalobacteraceae bacterium]|nr:GNAT family N-acetyltransferase [Oxalobacteraceae bacterium]
MFSSFTLRGKRVELRPIAERDAAVLFELYSDPEVMRYWNHAPWTSIDQSRTAIDEARSDHASGASLHCAIEHRESGVLIGSCALYAFAPQHSCASLGDLLAREYWGQGYLSEAMRVLLDYAFAELKLNRIEADVNRGNAGSAMALDRLGFRHEGSMRERWIVAGEKRDTESYGLLRSDWCAKAVRISSKPFR